MEIKSKLLPSLCTELDKEKCGGDRNEKYLVKTRSGKPT